MVDRRNLIIGGAAAAVAVGGGAWYLFGRQEQNFTPIAGVVSSAPGADVAMDKLMAPAGDVPEHSLGNPDAKVVLIEYLSPSCPHCAAFHAQVYPQFKEEYVDSDKVLFVPRPFVRNVLDSAIFLLAEAAGDEHYHEVIDTYFDTQNTWVTAERPNDALLSIAKQLGFTKESYDAALTNQTLFQGMEDMKEQAIDDFGVTGTPTFFINGKILRGESSFDSLKAEIDPLLG